MVANSIHINWCLILVLTCSITKWMEENHEKMKIEMWFLEYKVVKRQGYGINHSN